MAVCACVGQICTAYLYGQYFEQKGWLDGGTAMDDKVHKQESTIHNIAIISTHNHPKHASWHNSLLVV